MSEWNEKTLANLIKIKHGWAFKGEFITEVPNNNIVLTPGNFYIGGGFKKNKFKFYTGDFPEDYILKEGDVVVTMTDLSKEGDTLGYSAKLPKDKRSFLHNQRIGLVELISNDTDLDFIYWLMRTRNYQKTIVNSASGTTVRHTSPTKIQEYSFYLPPKKEQIAISHNLTILDSKIDLLRRQNQTLENIAQTLFKRWFVDFEFPDKDGNPYKSSGGKMVASELGEIPERWRVGVFNELIEFTNGYAFKSKEVLSVPSKNCYAVFKMGDIKKGGGFNESKTKSFIEKEKCGHILQYVLRKGDILMCMTDMKDSTSLLGHTALMFEDNRFIVNQRVGLIRTRNNINIDYPWIYILTNSSGFICDLRNRANSGVQINLSTNEIKNSRIIIPDKKINKQFDELAKSIYEKTRINTSQIQTLSKTRDILLPKLMSGQLRVKSL